MAVQSSKGYPVLIIGAGREARPARDVHRRQSGQRDRHRGYEPDAPGMQLARRLGIPTYTDAVEALQAGKDHPDCIVYNLSHDDSIADKANSIFGDKRVASGLEVKLFWQMVTNLKQIKANWRRAKASCRPSSTTRWTASSPSTKPVRYWIHPLPSTSSAIRSRRYWGRT